MDKYKFILFQYTCKKCKKENKFFIRINIPTIKKEKCSDFLISIFQNTDDNILKIIISLSCLKCSYEHFYNFIYYDPKTGEIKTEIEKEFKCCGADLTLKVFLVEEEIINNYNENNKFLEFQNEKNDLDNSILTANNRVNNNTRNQILYNNINNANFSVNELNYNGDHEMNNLNNNTNNEYTTLKIKTSNGKTFNKSFQVNKTFKEILSELKKEYPEIPEINNLQKISWNGDFINPNSTPANYPGINNYPLLLIPVLASSTSSIIFN